MKSSTPPSSNEESKPVAPEETKVCLTFNSKTTELRIEAAVPALFLLRILGAAIMAVCDNQAKMNLANKGLAKPGGLVKPQGLVTR